MVLSFEQAGDLLDTLAESFPEALFDGLNGGVNLQEEAVPDQEFPKGQVYILGEYCDDLLGRYINLYYGSFAAMAENEEWTKEDWEEELRQTLSHELTHHMEGRSGLHALDDKDEAEMAAWQEEYGESDS
nr:metallopeptidase family protein [uncultured Oscillibacter sp.]